MAKDYSIPKDILIIGSGVFGLSTAKALLENQAYDSTSITIIDSSAILPNPVGSSVDASRIIRADYANLSYAKLACLAQEHWRDQSPNGWGGEGRYSQTGFVLSAEKGQAAYVTSSMHNVQDLARQGLPMEMDKIQGLEGREAIKRATKLVGASGEMGYANWNSGWADAEACIAYAIKRIQNHPNNKGRIRIIPNQEVSKLLFSDRTAQCIGAECTNNKTYHADLTILATGAWTPSLFDLSNRALATGQAIAFIKLTPEEQEYLKDTPVNMNFARGTFIIAPHPTTHELKIARHGFGYRNPQPCNPLQTKSTSSFSTASANVSVPKTDTQMPIEAEQPLRDALAELFPPTYDETSAPPGYPSSLRDINQRPFTNSRLCWYTDTPTGNFVIDYPSLPSRTSTGAKNTSLFIATGGSGHGFKFLPILGNYILNAIEGTLDPEYKAMWAWPETQELEKQQDAGLVQKAESGRMEFLECNDGSRGGPRGMILDEELQRGVVSVESQKQTPSHAQVLVAKL